MFPVALLATAFTLDHLDATSAIATYRSAARRAFAQQAPPSQAARTIELDAKFAFNATNRVGFDNRVGFAFASLDVGSEDGEDSTIAGSRARLARVASVLEAHPDVKLMVEGHVGTTAPEEIAQSWSEQRSHIVAQMLEELGVQPERVETRGWGMGVAAAAQESSHPNARAAKAGYGWAELFFVAPQRRVPGEELVFPERPEYYHIREEGPEYYHIREEGPEYYHIREEGLEYSSSFDLRQGAPPPPPVLRSQPTSHPIFYMCPGTEPGERLMLHFFEPRYKLLVKRAWASDKKFVFCARPPMYSAAASSFNLRFGEEPYDDACVEVSIDAIRFDEAGEADIVGTAGERMTLDTVTIEPGTGGLFSTTTRLPSSKADELSRLAEDELAGDGHASEVSVDKAADKVVLEPSLDKAAAATPSAYPPLIRERYHLGEPSEARHMGMYWALTYVLLLSAVLGFALSALCRGGAANHLRFCPAPPKKLVVVTEPLDAGRIVLVSPEV